VAGNREGALDQAKRATIVAILTNGSSRRIAARYVGCSPSTISRTAERDPQFAEQIERAEQSAEILALRNLRNASSHERYWRAAAWLLERKNPRDFGPCTVDVFGRRQTIDAMVKLFSFLTDGMPDEECDHLFRKMDELLEEFQRTGAANSLDPVASADARVCDPPDPIAIANEAEVDYQI
jgi:hypothetical protein